METENIRGKESELVCINRQNVLVDHAYIDHNRRSCDFALPKGGPMLELRPNCESCDKDLPPESEDAMICSFECTFCRDCVDAKLNGLCPNCGGNFAHRPIRPEPALARFPASTTRILAK